jgi:outer membrane protein assembly factor BamB
MLEPTRCCSVLALALIVCASVSAGGAPPASPFPVHTVWTLPLTNGLVAPPAFAGNQAYVPVGPDDPHLAAIDLSTGRLRWLVQADVRSRPASGNGHVYIVEPGAITALHDADGSRDWRLALVEALAVPLMSDRGSLIAATQSGSILNLRASDGQLIWRRDLGAPLHAPPALADNRVYLPAADGRIVALQLATGAPVWERQLGGAPNDLLVLHDRLYAGSQDHFLYCLDVTHGAIAWKFPTGGEVIGLPIVDERRVYVVSLDNVLRALNKKSGSQEWKRPLPLRPTRGPFRIVDDIFVSGIGPTIHVYRAKDGQAAGDIPAGATAALAPALVDASHALIVVVTDDLAKGVSITAFGK